MFAVLFAAATIWVYLLFAPEALMARMPWELLLAVGAGFYAAVINLDRVAFNNVPGYAKSMKRQYGVTDQ